MPGAVQLALDEGGDRQDQHDGQHDRQIQHKAGIDAEQRGALRDGEGCQRDRHAADQHKVKDIRTDDVASDRSLWPLTSEVTAVTSSGSEVRARQTSER